MKWLRFGIGAVAIGYLVALLTILAGLEFVAERWWVTGVGLFLPRLLFAVPLPGIAIALAAVGPRKLLWTQVVAALVLLFPLMGFVVPSPRPIRRDQQAPAIRVLSYNINSGHEEGVYDEVIAEINRLVPDIVFLQETGATEKVADLLGGEYPHIYAADQFLVATRYPMITTEEPPKLLYDYDGRLHSPRFVRVVIDTPVGALACYNVHPVSAREAIYRAKSQGKIGLLTGRVFSSAYAATFYGNSGLRELQVKTFSELAGRETNPVLIAGDTNLPDLSLVLRNYLGRYQDAFLKTGFGFGYTFPTNKWAPWLRLDRILASSELQFIKFERCASKASDHFCVVADLQRRAW
ncbi:MAG: endonuclease/exonuclease/phosphatase family protein [Myxococcota bacterium]|nr:endonuclease/exonuclease/phosphatase family protein [Myxococcota bacterium]